ncbi:MAG: quinone-dependent dihydroorotate dehydrogenase, partial [Betaproteobacteria bacterium]|nr:quinone-dependent dihydroorotate dehydrogenase [Betaproteobacteria bacterium]
MMINWYPIARSLMFCLDAEEAHHLGLSQLRALASSGLLKYMLDESIDDPIELMGLTLLNRVGL